MEQESVQRRLVGMQALEATAGKVDPVPTIPLRALTLTICTSLVAPHPPATTGEKLPWIRVSINSTADSVKAKAPSYHSLHNIYQMADEEGVQGNDAGKTGSAVDVQPPPQDSEADDILPSGGALSQSHDSLDSDSISGDDMDEELRTAEAHDDIQHSNTILHRVAKCKEHLNPALVRLPVKEHPDLMEAQDERGRTALHLAVSLGRGHVVKAMVEIFEDIDDIVRIPADNGNKSLHTAIASNLPHSLVVALIQRASKRTLCVQDQHGLTPLHVAVSYHCCKLLQLEVVRELLKAGAGALSIFTKHPDMLSPYQYHAFTRKEMETKSAFQKPSKAKHGEAKALSSTNSCQLPALPERLDAEIADQINDELKLWALRTRSEEKVKKILYGHRPNNMHLSFSFLNCPASIDATAFQDAYGRLEFDSFLFQVSLGDCHFETKGRQKHEEGKGMGRAEAVFFFNWLRAKSVHLHWGSNNAVLRAWSEPEGLPRLKNLKRIELTAHEEQSVDLSTGILTKGSGTPAEAEIQRWFRCMNSFVECLHRFRLRILNKTRELEKLVKVALVDDGVDFLDPRVRGHIFSGTNSYETDTGHGTQMAALILRMCPMVEVYGFKANTSNVEGRRLSISSATDAVKDAMARDVDIISMPWSIDSAGKSTREDIHMLRKTLDEVRASDIILFCANPDHGYSRASAEGYSPVAADVAITISAPPIWQSNLEIVEGYIGVDFVFPGTSVVESDDGSATSIEGSSVATALAAELAAIILCCVRLTDRIHVLNSSESAWDDIR
ncbi:hypothetical protein S40293_10016 [Stachybotrys chartarum IBT 40293]|nr:hypothetical protein S40293_10016 [Stachybotrys chartarum IBT 40293]